MKTINTFLLLLLTAFYSNAQTAQQHQAPPVNNFPYSRGMYVDCTNDILADISNGNPSGAFDELKTYIRENYISYLALYDLDHGKVIGNPVLESTLKYFLQSLRSEFPSIRIGAVGKKYGYTNATPTVRISDYFARLCRTQGITYSEHSLDTLINSSQTIERLQRSETLKFFLRLISFSTNNTPCNPCNADFDVFYLEDPYWQDASTGTLADVQQKFESFKSTLNVMQMMKCSCKNISIETEFQPTDVFRLSGWTVTDQITQADLLIDRMMIPFYTNPFNANNAFDTNCKLLHLLSDRFSKNGTKFYTGFSAQSNAFVYCNSAATPQEHLGRYLSGITGMAAGNMYSVEKAFLNKLNNPTYKCVSCACYTYQENQFSSSNLQGNQIAGSMWFSYSMLKNNGLFRVNQNENSSGIIVDQQNLMINISSESDEAISYKLLDIQGRVIKMEMNKSSIHQLDLSDLNNGNYILMINTESGKQFSRRIPVLNR